MRNIVIASFEYLFYVFKLKKSYPYLETLSSIVSQVFRGYALELINLGIITYLTQIVFAHRLIPEVKLGITGQIILFVIIDFFYYLTHRIQHTVRIFWLIHAVHHLPNAINFLVAPIRSVTSHFFSLMAMLSILFAYFGVPPIIYFYLYGINLFYQRLIHTEIIPKLGTFEYFFNTPAQHRIHHSALSSHHQKNFSGVFSLFDQIFKTFHLDTEKINSYGPGQMGIADPYKYEIHLINDFVVQLRCKDKFFEKVKFAFENPTSNSISF